MATRDGANVFQHRTSRHVEVFGNGVFTTGLKRRRGDCPGPRLLGAAVATAAPGAQPAGSLLPRGLGGLSPKMASVSVSTALASCYREGCPVNACGLRGLPAGALVAAAGSTGLARSPYLARAAQAG